MSPPQREARAGGGDSSLDGVKKAVRRLYDEMAGDGPAGTSSSLSGYELVRELGSGGQGTVYLARQPRLGRAVALKVFAGWGAASFHSQWQRFEREASVASRLDDPGLCSVYEYGADGGTPFIAMQFVEGESLADCLRRARESKSGATVAWPAPDDPSARNPASSDSRRALAGLEGVPRTVAVIEAVARALHHAHEVGVIHRDVKPGNVMIRRDGSPVVVDFGFALDETSDATRLTQTAARFGTPAYMSPEQARGAPADRRTDVYSLGVTLFECLTGRHPFDGPNREAVLKAVCEDEPPDVRSLNPKVPADLKVVVEAALEKDLGRRYATALALAEDLRRVAERRPVLARPVRWPDRLWRWARRNPRVAVLSGVLAATLLAATIGFREMARAARREADEKKAMAERLRLPADAARMRRLIERAELLWPPGAQPLAVLEEWLDESRAFVAELPKLEAELTRMRARAAEDERGKRHIADPAEARTVAELMGLEDAILEVVDDEKLPAHVRRRLGQRLDGVEDELERLQSPERPVRFSAEWRLDLVAELVDALRRIDQPETGLIARVQALLDLQRELHGRTIVEPAQAWRETIAGIARSPRHHGLTITPQLGLIPLGPDPDSGLYEFLHLQTHHGPIPIRDGRLEITEDTGLVFVLLPGGPCRCGVRGQGAGVAGASPPRELDLDPFFISKYEMTQGQWWRTEHAEPSVLKPGVQARARPGEPFSRLHPVELVSWHDCDRALRRLGLDFPTGSQWEYAARGGTQTPWWWGDERPPAEPVANVADLAADRARARYPVIEQGYRDGYVFHAPVDALAPNPFGLHHVIGNVLEWCRENVADVEIFGGREGRSLLARPIERKWLRGGSFADDLAKSSVTVRTSAPATYRSDNTGVRPIRRLVRGRER